MVQWKLVCITIKRCAEQFIQRYGKDNVYKICETFQGNNNLYYLIYIKQSEIDPKEIEIPALINTTYPGRFGTVEYIDYNKEDDVTGNNKKRDSIGVLRFETPDKSFCKLNLDQIEQK